MNTTLLTDFIVDKENKRVTIKREFAARLHLVWEAWTNPELLYLWRAPKPWRTETKTMELKAGGFWLYAIVSPQGNRHWSRYDYQKIEPLKSITELRAFCDENGNRSPDFPRTLSTITFEESNGKTIVTETNQYGNLEIFEQMSSSSHQKGYGSTFENLDKILNDLKK